MLNPREELVFLLRGFFATPILTALGKNGILSKLLEEEVDPYDLGQNVNSDFLRHAFVYLQSIGLLININGNSNLFKATDLGKKIFSRYGSIVLLYSYRDLISNVDQLLFDNTKKLPSCDRLDNVIGSGLTNGRKFFPAGVNAVSETKCSVIIDLACGDGEFLSRMHVAHPEASIVAADLSPIAIESTKKNLLSKYPSLDLKTVQTDALNIENWMPVDLDEAVQNKSGVVLICMWYLVHEIAKHDPIVIADFFNGIYSACPEAQLLIGEIVNIDPELLSVAPHQSIMPEFLFFHELSGQGVLTWQQYNELLDLIPYRLVFEQQFDMMCNDAEQIPSAIVWYLQPK